MRDELTLSRKGRPLTGRIVFLMLVAFFGVIIAVNLVMVRFASSTFSGRGDKNAYIAGLSYNKSLVAAREQDSRGWKVDASLRRTAPGRSAIRVERSDGGAFVDVQVSVRFEHPSTGRMDRAVPLAPAGSNAWRSVVDLPAGAWDMIIEMRSAGTTVFLSRDRITASDAKIEADG